MRKNSLRRDANSVLEVRRTVSELGVERAGALLAEHFPASGEDKNELPDDVEDV